MNLEKLKQELIEYEGKVSFVYSDLDGKPTWPGRDKGNPTFGIGHKLTPKDVEWYAYKNLDHGGELPISNERINEIFEKDLQVCLQDCRVVFYDFDKKPEELQLIIANMMFALGRTKFFGFEHFILAIKTANYLEAASYLRDSKWWANNTTRVEKLRKRLLALTKINFYSNKS
ncbi:MAG TPA: hypothetical protein PKK61_14570 [Defluviitaleaceae bacterium]|nr:hypothetical protein [Defluviitaleaceae bacterium]